MGQCKSIQTLKIKGTEVTKIGIQVALENLPKLRDFEFYRSVQILAELRKADLERGHIKSYSITKFECMELKNDYGNPLPYENESLRLAANMCPFVNVVYITMQTGLTDIELHGLLELRKLREFGISDPHEFKTNEITFDGGILPLLKVFGDSLLRLELHGLDCLNMRAIAECCPHLEHLSLSNNDQYSMAWLEEERHPFCSKRRKKDLILKNLKVFYLSCQSEFSSEMFPLVLSSQNLVQIVINDCDAFTDDVIEDAYRLHQFRNLDDFQLSDCNYVTKNGIDTMLNEKIPLTMLALMGCHMITQQQHFDEWENKAKEKNWNIAFPFFLRDSFYEEDEPVPDFDEDGHVSDEE